MKEQRKQQRSIKTKAIDKFREFIFEQKTSAAKVLSFSPKN